MKRTSERLLPSVLFRYVDTSAVIAASGFRDVGATHVQRQSKLRGPLLPPHACHDDIIVALAHAKCLDQDFERSGDFVEALRSYQRAAALGHAPACAVSAWLHIDLMLGPGSRADEAHS
jgi:hypothetical protein